MSALRAGAPVAVAYEALPATGQGHWFFEQDRADAYKLTAANFAWERTLTFLHLVWQVLLHVVNHDTDHRAQLLRSLHDLGRQTSSQDYIFYVYDHP